MTIATNPTTHRTPNISPATTKPQPTVRRSITADIASMPQTDQTRPRLHPPARLPPLETLQQRPRCLTHPTKTCHDNPIPAQDPTWPACSLETPHRPARDVRKGDSVQHFRPLPASIVNPPQMSRHHVPSIKIYLGNPTRPIPNPAHPQPINTAPPSLNNVKVHSSVPLQTTPHSYLEPSTYAPHATNETHLGNLIPIQASTHPAQISKHHTVRPEMTKKYAVQHHLCTLSLCHSKPATVGLPPHATIRNSPQDHVFAAQGRPRLHP